MSESTMKSENFDAGRGVAPAHSLAGPEDYFSLLKPRVMSLVIFTALVGAGTFYLLSNMTPVYTSETTVLIETGESDLTFIFGAHCPSRVLQI